MKKVLIISGNYSPEKTGIGKYSGEMVDWLSDNGYFCSVITTYPYYPDWKVQVPYEKSKLWYKTEKNSNKTIYRCPCFIPKSPNGKTRILLDFSFFFSAFIRLFLLLFTSRFDAIIVVSPPFFTGFLAIFYKLFKKTKFIYHIQDLQIDAAKELNIVKSDKIIKLLFFFEKLIFKKADYISTISNGMVRKIKEKGFNDIVKFPNWTNIYSFFPLNVSKSELKQLFGFKDTDTIILYSGAIGEKQGLEIILEASKYFIHDSNIKFIICGAGPYRALLQNIVELQQCQNIYFFPLQPIEKLNQFLNAADVHLVIQKKGASDLVMPSKLTNILAVGGTAVISAQLGSSLYEEVEKFKIGIIAEPEDIESLRTALYDACYRQSDEIKKNARAYAEKYISQENVIKAFISEIQL